MVTDTRAPDPATPAVAAGVLEKPSIDGLEEKWVERWAAEDTYAFDRAAALAGSRGGIYSIDTPRRRPAARCTWGTSSATPTPISSPATSGCAAARLLPDGLGRQRPADRAARAELLRRPLRTPHYDPTFEPPANPGKDQLPISRRNFVELRMQLTEEDERAFEQLWRRVGLGRLVERLPDDLRGVAGDRAAGCS